MKLRKALFDYYHKYKNTEYLCNSFNLISYISDYCSNDFQELYELQVYIKIIKQINIIQVIIENGYNESIDYLKLKFKDLVNIEFKDYKMAVFYTLKMFQDDYVDNSLKEQEKIVIKKKQISHSSLIECSNHPITITSKKNEKAYKIFKDNDILKSKLIYYNKDSKDKIYHYNPECKNLLNMYNLCYGNQKYLVKYKKNQLCPLCCNSNISDPSFCLTGLSIKRLLYYSAISKNFIKTNFLVQTSTIYQMLKNAGPSKNVYYNGLVIWYEKNNIFKTLYIKVE